jgi:hypothetical protein
MTPAEIIFNWWSNYKYTNHTNFSGEPPKMGEYVYFHGQVRKRDTVMFSSREDRSKPFVQITAHYYALLTDGSSFDDSFQREEPFSFPIGQGRTIAGWEEGLALFKEGAKFILFTAISHVAVKSSHKGSKDTKRNTKSTLYLRETSCLGVFLPAVQDFGRRVWQ